MSTLHLPEGYQYKFYPAKRPTHQHVLEVLSPHIPTITLAILALTLLQWHTTTTIYRFIDLSAYACCLLLYNTSHPLLSLCLAVSHTTWSSLPGSLSSLTLPSFPNFLLTTKFTSPPHTQEDEKCMVCWDSSTPLGTLPCKHLCCKSCLQAMATAYQTACPLCTHPLFAIHDCLLFCINKATLSIQATTLFLHLLILWDEIQHHRYKNIGIEVMLQLFMIWLTTKVYIPQIKKGGENWWRPCASCKGGVGRGMGMIGVSFVSGVVVLAQTVYMNRNLFT